MNNIKFEEVWDLLGRLGHIVIPDGEEHGRSRYSIPDISPEWARNPHEQEPEEEEGGIVDNGDEDGSQQPGPSSNRLAEEEEEGGDQVPLYINGTNPYQDQASAKYKLQEAGLYKYKWLLKSKLFPKSVA